MKKACLIFNLIAINTCFADNISLIKNNEIYIPANSFLKVKMIASAEVTSRSNESFLFFIESGTQVVSPSKYTPSIDLSECFISGTGKADVESQRIKIKTTKISCVDNSRKQAYEKSIDGYIVDVDGNAGIKASVKRMLTSESNTEAWQTLLSAQKRTLDLVLINGVYLSANNSESK
jgi:hypothetical protein